MADVTEGRLRALEAVERIDQAQLRAVVVELRSLVAELVTEVRRGRECRLSDDEIYGIKQLGAPELPDDIARAARRGLDKIYALHGVKT